uniref:Choline/carnitine acyltransferase domain-containing protein n=1 Tax=Eptatretus burgeri TaxID=7764 RepID=A0A8C4QCE4_EPTBU
TDVRQAAVPHSVLANQRRQLASLAASDLGYLHRSLVPTMHFQKSLPRYGSTATLDYLSCHEPRTEDLTRAFEVEEGRRLHKALLAMDKKNKHTSYISGKFFLSRINTQAVRATNLAISAARFMRTLRDGFLEPDVFHLNPAHSDTPAFRRWVRLLPPAFSWYGAYLRNAYPLDMSQYVNLFCSTRIPCARRDQLKMQPDAKHLLVMRLMLKICFTDCAYAHTF